MEDEGNLHDIFITDPNDLLKFVDNFVKITLKNGEVICGSVFTIDPVSQSVVLVTEELSLIIVLKHSITSMELVPEDLNENKKISINNLFNSNQITSTKTATKEDVKDWLLKNMIPVEESGDKLIIDSLEIHPPYGVDQCYSSNSIVLARIQKLLKQMPARGS